MVVSLVIADFGQQPDDFFIQPVAFSKVRGSHFSSSNFSTGSKSMMYTRNPQPPNSTTSEGNLRNLPILPEVHTGWYLP